MDHMLVLQIGTLRGAWPGQGGGVGGWWPHIQLRVQFSICHITLLWFQSENLGLKMRVNCGRASSLRESINELNKLQCTEKEGESTSESTMKFVTFFGISIMEITTIHFQTRFTLQVPLHYPNWLKMTLNLKLTLVLTRGI